MSELRSLGAGAPVSVVEPVVEPVVGRASSVMVSSVAVGPRGVVVAARTQAPAGYPLRAGSCPPSPSWGGGSVSARSGTGGDGVELGDLVRGELEVGDGEVLLEVGQ
ncbi:hypothetical protein GCM10009814_11970 [Lapillicoccus jejuensis]